ncbi:MAG: cysteine desulfurase family protein [Candidatus Comchoanobacterales bacterium]
MTKVPQTHYFDYAATTPLDPRVLAVMNDVLRDSWYNANATYSLAEESHALLEQANKDVLSFLGAPISADLVWTSGATEANNLAIKGTFFQYKSSQLPIIISPVDHASIVECALDLKKYHHASIEWMSLNHDVSIHLEDLEKKLKSGALLVSVTAVHSELGYVPPLHEIRALTKQYGALLHIDAVQALGKMAINLNAWDPDLMTLSAHKCFGPKGAGLLYIKDRNMTPIRPLLSGKGGLSPIRPGTIPLHQICGMAKAICLSPQWLLSLDTIVEQSKMLHHHLIELGCQYLGPSTKVPHIQFVALSRFHGTHNELVEQFGLSRGSACLQGGLSKVLDYMTLDKASKHLAYRLCINHLTDDKAINDLLQYIQKHS